jgi:hypothetical protein
MQANFIFQIITDLGYDFFVQKENQTNLIKRPLRKRKFSRFSIQIRRNKSFMKTKNKVENLLDDNFDFCRNFLSEAQTFSKISQFFQKWISFS